MPNLLLVLLPLLYFAMSCSTVERVPNSNANNNVKGISFNSPRSPATSMPSSNASMAPPANAIAKVDSGKPFTQTIDSLDQIKSLGQPSTGLVPGGL